MPYHIPVLARESIEMLQIQKDGIYVDATFGGGGHSTLIMNELGDEGRLLAFDQDEDASANVLDDDRFIFIQHNFEYLKRFLKLYGYPQIDGILADLGVSSHQFDEASRGFSFRFDAQLDMRMNQQDKLTAAHILNTYDASALQDIFSRYGEVRNARTLSLKIVEQRGHKGFESIQDLLSAIEPLIRGQRNKYLAQVFQALRMEVNQETDVLKNFLTQCLEVLKPGGRLVVITYHSIEDRIVKRFLKFGNADGIEKKDFFGNIYRPFKIITRKALLPSEEEIKQNPRARSAKLRVAETTEKED